SVSTALNRDPLLGEKWSLGAMTGDCLMGSNPQKILGVAGWTGFQAREQLEAKMGSAADDNYQHGESGGEVAALQLRLAEEVGAWRSVPSEHRPLWLWPTEDTCGADAEATHQKPADEPILDLVEEAPMECPADVLAGLPGKELCEAADAPQPEAATPDANKQKNWWPFLRTAVAIAAVIALGWTPLQRFLQTTSAEATVNARLVTVRAPIDGTVRISEPVSGVGATIGEGSRLLTIDNPRAERAQLDTLRREITLVDTERGKLVRRKAQLQALQAKLAEQRDAFQQGRIEQLEARVAEVKAEIAAATAKHEETGSALERTQQLNARGWQTKAAMDEADRNHKVAVSSTEALRHKLIATNVELKAARRGLFVGDSYNDIPRTAQRLDEVAQEVIELDGEIDAHTARLATLKGELTHEQSRYVLRSNARLDAPVDGRVWEMLTSDGEQVSRGQELMRVLDCGGALVTAAVSEGVYNKLHIGQAATFRLRGESSEREGRVIGLNGLAAVPANLAIEKKALAREPYHVTVQVPTLASGPHCHVGRSGKVTFGDGTALTTASL
ncbi:MAG: HlyD family efflux transporter periplasmic adaptor subunit, partial [Pseudomonadota bacterium]